jgi:translation initiation factor eIF-2B subunit delta
MELFSDQEEELILILGGVHLLQMIFMEAKDSNKRFKVVVADTSPDFEGREMVKRLSNYGIKCIYTMISGISFLIHKVTKVFIGASSVLSNGAVVAKIGTSMLTFIATHH